MKLLLDTHTLIWSLDKDHPSLSQKAKISIDSPENQVFVSIASLWEIAIKVSINKLEVLIPIEMLSQHLQRVGIQLLRIEPEDVVRVRHLPFLHRDPFDRILIAQAQNLGLTLVSADAQLLRYDVNVIW